MILKTIPLFILLLISFASSAADVEAGKTKAALCAACHGAEGISPSPLWPNLAGQKEAYLVKQIIAFQTGERKDPSMAPMVAGLSKTDVENIAAYYASLK